jgi:hypothetical protein
MHSIAEYFLLREASAAAARMSEAKRRVLIRDLTIARQKGQAATALWSNGHTAEGLRLAIDALEATLAAASHAAAEAEHPAASWTGALAAHGVPKERLEAIADTLRRARASALPRLDREVELAHIDLYHEVTRARLEVEGVLARAALGPRDLAVLRHVRIGTAVAVGVLALSGLALGLRRTEHIQADASDTFGQSPLFAPRNAFDGDPATEWLLNDHQTGWIEARFQAPRTVSRVVVRNARNAPHFDRATREYRVELYAGDRMIASVAGVFEVYERDPEPRVIPIRGEGVTRVRFVVLGYHHVGGGIAEMEIDD